MLEQSKSRVIGAFAVGLLIVVGAYFFRHAGVTNLPQGTQSATVVEAPPRMPIAILDSNNDGIEDWREKFVSAAPVVLANEDESYVIPDTLTAQMGIAFMQDIIRSEGYGGFGKSKEEVVKATVAEVSKVASDYIFDVKDITIISDNSAAAVRQYANTHAETIMQNSVPGLRNEALILRDVISGLGDEGIKELKIISQVYLNTRNAVINIPVPPQLVKEHLDLINIYNALYKDIESMSKALEDPMLSLVRLKRYQDDVDGLVLALQNIFLAIEPYASSFKPDDSALLFVNFSPNFNG